jgi:RHS repeat-associated protein
VQHKVDLADGWVIATLDDPFSLPCQIVVDQKAHLTEVRLSERERYVFRPTLFNGMPLSGGCLGDVGFELVDGTTPGAELDVVGNTSVRAPGAILDDPGDPVGFNGTLTDPETGLPYEARDFQLRTEDGRVFDLNIVRGVVRIADRNENELFINANGIVSSSGKSITFTRDGAGRITRITDPMSRTLDYAYDTAGDLVSFTNQTADETTFTYGTEHDLLEIHDPNGVRAAKQEFDADGRLVAVIDAAGHRIELVHDLVTREETREDRLGFRETFTYDERGNVTQQVDREGKVWTYAYDTADNQTSATDPLGNTTTATFDASHRKLTETNALGDTRSWTYDARGNVLTETDFDGKTTTNTYDARGNLLTTTAPDATVTTFTHDLQGNPTSITNALGHVATATYNIDGNLIATTDPAGHAVQYVYDAAGNTLRSSETRTTAAGTTETLTTRFRYDAANRMVETTDPLGHVTKTEYDRNGRVTAQVDPLGRRDESVYDELGRLVEQKAPDGAKQRTEYDAEDQATARIDEAGRLTQFFYDGTGRPTRTRYVDDSETTSHYDDAGRLTRVVDRRGSDTEFGYDAAGRQTVVRDALDHETTTTYDEAGRRLTVTDANGRTTSFAYDEAGRLETTTFPDLTTSRTEYDALGRVTAEIDPKGTRTEFEYDALGRLTLVRDADGGETAYSYDEVGNRVAMTDAMGRVRRTEYDGLGRMTAEVKPLGQRKTTTYDAVGQITAMRDYNGRVATMSYDPRGRLIYATHGDATETRYAYTVTGQLALVQDATGVTTFAYDDQDRLVEQVRPGGGTLRYGYDAEGNRTRIETPSGVTTFGYDAVGRPSTILDAQGGITTYGYDAANNRTSLTQPNGVTTTYARDARDRLTTIESRTAGNTLLARYAYTLDAAGNRTGVTEATGRTATWQYDALYRLVAETITEPAGSPETESFGYDAVGNRVFRATDAGVEASVYDDNDRLLDDGTATYTWDEQGNLRSKTDTSGTTQYRWDGRDRLIEVSGPITGLVQHVYDHAGDRIETRVGGVATRYMVDANRGLSQILEERTAGGALIASYVHSDDGMPLARFDAAAAAASYYLHDAQQSVRQLASGGGAITDAYSYTAFGETQTATGINANRFRYGGQWSDPTTALQHLRARWMDLGIGRFLTMDRFVGNARRPLTQHRYLYAAASPIDNADPTGLYTQHFGYAVEDVVEDVYRQQHPRNRTTFGGLQFGVKPDIVDHTLREFMEIKPLSMSGIAKGIAQIAVYTGIFVPVGYNRGSWTPPSPQRVDGTLTWFMNIQGVIFYTDDETNVRELLVVTTFAAARAALRRTTFVATRLGIDAAATAVRNRLLGGVAQAAAIRISQYEFQAGQLAFTRF